MTENPFASPPADSLAAAELQCALLVVDEAIARLTEAWRTIRALAPDRPHAVPRRPRTERDMLRDLLKAEGGAPVDVPDAWGLLPHRSERQVLAALRQLVHLGEATETPAGFAFACDPQDRPVPIKRRSRSSRPMSPEDVFGDPTCGGRVATPSARP